MSQGGVGVVPSEQPRRFFWRKCLLTLALKVQGWNPLNRWEVERGVRGDGGGGGEKTAFQVGPHHTHEVTLLVLIQGGGAGEGGSGDLVQGLLVSSPISSSSVALPE